MKVRKTTKYFFYLDHSFVSREVFFWGGGGGEGEGITWRLFKN